jgi:hypothetical protein
VTLKGKVTFQFIHSANINSINHVSLFLYISTCFYMYSSCIASNIKYTIKFFQYHVNQYHYKQKHIYLIIPILIVVYHIYLYIPYIALSDHVSSFSSTIFVWSPKECHQSGSPKSGWAVSKTLLDGFLGKSIAMNWNIGMMFNHDFLVWFIAINRKIIKNHPIISRMYRYFWCFVVFLIVKGMVMPW